MAETRELYWDSTYAIVASLMEYYPTQDPVEVGMGQLVQMIIDLPGFADDEDGAATQFLLDILTTWYEEARPL